MRSASRPGGWRTRSPGHRPALLSARFGADRPRRGAGRTASAASTLSGRHEIAAQRRWRRRGRPAGDLHAAHTGNPAELQPAEVSWPGEGRDNRDAQPDLPAVRAPLCQQAASRPARPRGPPGREPPGSGPHPGARPRLTRRARTSARTRRRGEALSGTGPAAGRSIKVWVS